MGFKVGDKVRLRKECKPDEYYGGGKLNETTIKELKGKTLIIKDQYYEWFSFRGISSHRLTAEMMEYADGTEIIEPLL